MQNETKRHEMGIKLFSLKSYGVNIQVKPLQNYFHMVILII